MKILYLTDQIYLAGGAEKILIQKMNYWIEVFNYDVTLITTNQKGHSPFYKLNKAAKLIDLEINYVEGLSFFGPTNFLKLPIHILKLKRELTSLKPDAIFVISKSFVRIITPFLSKDIAIFNEYHTSYYATKLKLETCSFFQKTKTKAIGYINSLIETLYTKIIFLNEEEYNYYNLKNAVVIPNFFDANLSNKSIKKKKSVISLGRLCNQKGFDMLIDAWEIVDKEVIDWELNIYGDGDDFEILNKKIKKIEFNNPINLRLAINNVNEKLMESSFYVMSSRFETFPMVLLEAFSNKLPVISFDSPTGARNIITDMEDGFLIDPYNINQLASKIICLMNDKELRDKMSERALINVKRFNAEKIMKQWDLLIKSNLKSYYK
ncbi:glycosyltransferase family 4 protein [uncultured Lutibacter sp.]|uniref:glycosyltransferase family 4 protein n=1 Tax=uncultured Lutibacter sp. TaxID=437739 RepID=UPI002633E7F0|nr:glycosyltransferase family 4 protein [uncultured Lutibacter sp.]